MSGNSLVRDEKIEHAIKTHAPSLIRLVYTYAKNLADAEDIVQDVFLAFMESDPTIESLEHEKAWLIRVTINKSKDYVRSSWFRKRSPLTENLSYRPLIDGGGSDLVIAVLELDRKYRIPIHLYYYEDYSIKEIAHVLDANPATVATWLDRGRSLIRKRMEGTSDERIRT